MYLAGKGEHLNFVKIALLFSSRTYSYCVGKFLLLVSMIATNMQYLYSYIPLDVFLSVKVSDYCSFDMSFYD